MAKPKPVEKEGKVVSANRKFYVAIGRTRREIPTGPLVDAAAIKKLVGKTVPVTLVGKSVVAIGRRFDIICYVPADPFLFKLVQPDLQKMLQKKYREAGILAG
jgi:hypothetical protein